MDESPTISCVEMTPPSKKSKGRPKDADQQPGVSQKENKKTQRRKRHQHEEEDAEDDERLSGKEVGNNYSAIYNHVVENFNQFTCLY